MQAFTYNPKPKVAVAFKLEPTYSNLEKREQFAVSLRKNKKQEIIELKRKKTLEQLSKQKLFNKLNQKQTKTTEVPDFVQTPELVEQSLKAIQKLFEDRSNDDNLVRLMKGVRNLAAKEEPQPSFRCLLEHPLTIQLFIGVITHSNPSTPRNSFLNIKAIALEIMQ
jgi:hypothetical protein